MISSIKEKESAWNTSESLEILVCSLLDPAATAAAGASCPKLCFCLGGRFTGDCGIRSEIRLEAVG